MKRFWVLGLALALCLLGSLGASAQFSLDASYLISAPYTHTFPGSYEESAKADGWLLNADVTIAEPWGVQVRWASVDGTDYEWNGNPFPEVDDISMSHDRTDLLVSYAFPGEGAKLKLLAGYAWPKWGFDWDDYGEEETQKETWEFSGIVVGGQADFAVSENVKLGASLLYGPSLEFDYAYERTGDGDGSGSGTGNCLDYVLSADWEFMPNFAVQAGYRGTTFKYTFDKDEDDFEYTQKFSGFFLGGRATF